MAATTFISEMELADFLELIDEKYLYFCPDLPMRFGRKKSSSCL